jgi:hypothetical protein
VSRTGLFHGFKDKADKALVLATADTKINIQYREAAVKLYRQYSENLPHGRDDPEF